MPLYSFIDSTKTRTRDLFFPMREAPKVGETVTDEGEPWTRVFTVPNARIAVTIDPWSKTDFIKKTRDKKESWGAMWDRSAELSAKRAERDGTDKVKEKYLDGYEKRSKGVVHSERQRQKARDAAATANQDKGMKELGISVKVNV